MRIKIKDNDSVRIIKNDLKKYGKYFSSKMSLVVDGKEYANMVRIMICDGEISIDDLCSGMFVRNLPISRRSIKDINRMIILYYRRRFRHNNW